MEEAVRKSRLEPAGLNSHNTGGANRRPGMEVQMGALCGNGRLRKKKRKKKNSCYAPGDTVLLI